MRLRRLLTIAMVLTAISTAAARGAGSDLFAVKVQKVKDGVYVAYRPDPLRYFVEGNVTIIINERDVVVVDSGGAPAAGRNIIAEIRKLTRNPVRFLINTHDHVDHNLGNDEFIKAFPGIEIIAHPVARQNLIRDGTEYVASTIANRDSSMDKGKTLIERLRREGNEEVAQYWERYRNHDIDVRIAEYRKAKITPATLMVEDKLVLLRGTRRIEVMHIGHGDTEGDLIVYLPGEKIVSTGDMLTHPVPYGFTVRPDQWLATLRRLAELDIDYVIPGHGDILPGKTYLQQVIALVASVQEQVRSAVAAGLDLDKTRERVDVSPFVSQFVGTDPVGIYRFQGWFTKPHVEQVYAVIKAETERSR